MLKIYLYIRRISWKLTCTYIDIRVRDRDGKQGAVEGARPWLALFRRLKAYVVNLSTRIGRKRCIYKQKNVTSRDRVSSVSLAAVLSRHVSFHL